MFDYRQCGLGIFGQGGCSLLPFGPGGVVLISTNTSGGDA
jgi:hypothetical protein